MLHGPDASLRGPCLASAREDGLPGVSARLNDQAPGADGMTACAPSPLSLALDSRRVRRRSAARDLPPGRVSFLFAVLLLCGWHSGAVWPAPQHCACACACTRTGSLAFALIGGAG